MIRFYMKNGRWRVTCHKTIVPAQAWWDAINQVKCLNHQLRLKERNDHPASTRAPRPTGLLDL